jgi:hypothetical protein
MEVGALVKAVVATCSYWSPAGLALAEAFPNPKYGLITVLAAAQRRLSPESGERQERVATLVSGERLELLRQRLAQNFDPRIAPGLLWAAAQVSELLEREAAENWFAQRFTVAVWQLGAARRGAARRGAALLRVRVLPRVFDRGPVPGGAAQDQCPRRAKPRARLPSGRDSCGPRGDGPLVRPGSPFVPARRGRSWECTSSGGSSTPRPNRG